MLEYRAIGFGKQLLGFGRQDIDIGRLATILYVVSLILRLQAASGDTILAAIIGFLGLISLLVAGFLGGEMVFSKGTGVNHTAWEAGSDQFETVLPLEQVEEQKLYRVTASGVPVVLIRQSMQFHAIFAFRM